MIATHFQKMTIIWVTIHPTWFRPYSNCPDNALVHLNMPLLSICHTCSVCICVWVCASACGFYMDIFMINSFQRKEKKLSSHYGQFFCTFAMQLSLSQLRNFAITTFGIKLQHLNPKRALFGHIEMWQRGLWLTGYSLKASSSCNMFITWQYGCPCLSRMYISIWSPNQNWMSWTSPQATVCGRVISNFPCRLRFTAIIQECP